MDTNKPLTELKDVHLPEPVSIFPLAIGWYLLLVLIIIAIIGLIYWQLKQRERHRQKAEINQLLNVIISKSSHTTDEEIIGECSILLKRVAVLKFPEQKPQLLFGASWLEFLDKSLNKRGNTRQFTLGPGKCLGEIYKQQPIENKQQLFNLLNIWLESVL